MTSRERHGPTPRPRGSVAHGRWGGRAAAAAAGLAILAAAGLPGRADAEKALFREEAAAGDTTNVRVADPLRTLRVRKRYRELGQETGGSWTLDHEEGVSRRGGDGQGEPMPRAALDGLGLLYLLRTMDLETGDTIRLERHFQAEHNPVVFRVVGRQRIRVPAGRFRTVVVEPVIPALAVFREDRDPRLWLTDDARRLIVRVESATRFGPLQLHLRRYTPGEE